MDYSLSLIHIPKDNKFLNHNYRTEYRILLIRDKIYILLRFYIEEPIL
jgi:hypothetical protein